MSDTPLVSVVVPTLNRAGMLRPTLDSILAQDYAKIECIVVDAGSTDGTDEILRSYGDRITWFSRPDRGAFDAINDGWKLAKGDILAWLNADDTWETPGAVSTAVEYLQSHEDVDVVYGDCGGIDEGGTLVWYGPADPWDFETAVITCHPILNQPSAFMRREIIERVGYLYPAWCHDHDLWLRIALAGGNFAPLRQHLGNARLWAGNLHMKPSLVVRAKIELTKRLLTDPKLPTDLKRRRRQILSNAYIRCLDFLPKPAHWYWAVYVIGAAFVTSPLNTPRIVEQIAVHLAWLVPGLRRRLRKRYGHGVAIEHGGPVPARGPS